MDAKKYLENSNPWWKENYSPKSDDVYNLKRRFAFTKAWGFLTGTKLMLQLGGLRRLGKSTLIKQLIFDLIEKKHIDPNRLWFCEFSPYFNGLEKILDIAPAQSYIFLDEIQYCRHWRDILKLYYDSGKATRIIYSGSTAITYTKEKESLLGRFMPVTLLPLTFVEYLYLKYNGHPMPVFYNQENFLEYLQYGEFPELLSIATSEQKQAYLRDSVLEPIFTKDIVLYDVEKKAEFSDIFKIVSADLGQVINKQNIAREIQISRSIVDKYLKIFQAMGLVYAVPNYYRGLRQVLGSNKKMYSSSINLSLAHFRPGDLNNFSSVASKGQIFENFVGNELANKYGAQNIYYWRRQKKELDFIIQVNYTKFLAFEVKSKENMANNEKEMYRRYAHEVEKDAVTGSKIEFSPILWNFNRQDSPLMDIIMSNAIL